LAVELAVGSQAWRLRTEYIFTIAKTREYIAVFDLAVVWLIKISFLSVLCASVAIF
jgi:hypothetical protein